MSGIKGFLKINSYTQNPTDIQLYQNIWLENNQKFVTIKAIRKRKKQIIAQISDISENEQAQKLINDTLWIKEQQLKIIKQKDCYYYHHLKEMKVYNKDKVFIGKIIDVQNFGAGDVIEIEHGENHKNNFMLPFRKQFVPYISIEDKYAIIDNYQSLLE